MKFIFLLTTIFVSLTLSGQEKLFRLNLEGKSYEKLIMTFLWDSDIYIEGESQNGYNWIFKIPEDIYETAIYFRFSSQDFNIVGNRRADILFMLDETDKRTTSFSNFSDDNMILNLRYVGPLQTDIPPTQPVDVPTECFIVDFQGNTDLKLQFKHPLFSLFYDRSGEEKTYEDFLDEYYLICQSNPESRFLISTLFLTIGNYLDKKDVQKLYDCFCAELQNSYFGKIIKQYISFYNFENIELLCSDNINSRYIVENPDKYTLLIFSASWCIPCHKMVPTFKKLYDDLRENLDLVYVSVDRLETIAEWQSFLEKEKIPWSSFLSYNNEGFRKKYNITAIPTGLLVYPDGKAEVINLSRDESLKVLYDIFDIK